ADRPTLDRFGRYFRRAVRAVRLGAGDGHGGRAVDVRAPDGRLGVADGRCCAPGWDGRRADVHGGQRQSPCVVAGPPARSVL
ncbi:MAG: hypothetical protein AVDCRST_MAG10-3243, partial [uncultured Acidimicrobiales bacterium]